ncbi:MAG: efflux RND transporter periplasmic adaptor subunit [Oceanipulchritudo sp.]
MIRLGVMVVFGLGLIGGMAGCGRGGVEKAAPPPPAVLAETVTGGIFERRLELTGTVEAATLAALSSPAEGPVQDLRIREGDRVRKDQILLIIGRDASAEALLVSAREEVRRREKEMRRVESLVADGAMAEDQLDEARASLEHARAQLALAVQASSDFTVRAPWDGIVSRLHVADGRYVGPRAALLEMFDPESLVLRFQVPEEHAFRLRESDGLTAAFDAFDGKTLGLSITRAWPELDRRLRTRTFEARLPLAELPFAPGQFARLSVVLETVADALTVPVEAILAGTRGTKSIFTVDAGGIARRIEVETGFEQDGRVLIKSGLHPGDRVIVSGVEAVKPGQGVRVLQPGAGLP